MKGSVNKFIFVSGGMFLIYFANVLIGSMGVTTYLSDVSEMLLLLTTCVVFVVGILSLEKKEKNKLK